MSYKITINEKHEPAILDGDIQEYYRLLINSWNQFNDKAFLPLDRHTSAAKACMEFVKRLLFMHDKILQAEKKHQQELAEQKETIRRLEFELSKRTGQQRAGRKPIMNPEKHKQVQSLKANGMSNRAIAKEIGVSEFTVRCSLKINNHRQPEA